GPGGDGYYTIPSECEVCYVLEGTIELEIDGEVFALARGDAVTFGATVPHTWRNTSAEEARVVWVIAPALPDPRGQAAVPYPGSRRRSILGTSYPCFRSRIPPSQGRSRGHERYPATRHLL